jgi:hypothetical protein
VEYQEIKKQGTRDLPGSFMITYGLNFSLKVQIIARVMHSAYEIFSKKKEAVAYATASSE